MKFSQKLIVMFIEKIIIVYPDFVKYEQIFPIEFVRWKLTIL
jgi:hypothetical protein